MSEEYNAYTIVGLRVSKDLVDDIFNHLDFKCEESNCESNVHRNEYYCDKCIFCLEQFFEYSIYQNQYMDDIYVYCIKTKQNTSSYDPTKIYTIPWNWITKDTIDIFFNDMKAIKNRKGISVYEKYKDEEDKMGIHNVVSYS